MESNNHELFSKTSHNTNWRQNISEVVLEFRIKLSQVICQEHKIELLRLLIT